MKNLAPLLVAAGTVVLYAATVVCGLRLTQGGLSGGGSGLESSGMRAGPWRMEPVSGIGISKLHDIEFGSRLFNETPVYGSAYVKSRIACSNCHLQGGTAPYASPVVGIVPSFPMFSKRAGRAITLEDRIEECMTRSENGTPLPVDSAEMKALEAYIGWLSEPHRQESAFVGRGLETLPVMHPDAAHGAMVYAAQCAGCHGVDGEGARRPFPPLWGPEAFNDGAGMNGVEKMAAFVHVNMPQNRKGILSVQDSFDVAAYIHAQSRPAFNHAYDHF